MSICDSFDISRPLSCSSVTFVVTFIFNDRACKFGKLKQTFLLMRASIFIFFMSTFGMCCKVFNRLLRALIGFDKEQ